MTNISVTFASEIKLKQSGSKFCYSCHQEMQKKMGQTSHIHTAVAQGKCTVCHKSKFRRRKVTKIYWHC